MTALARNYEPARTVSPYFTRRYGEAQLASDQMQWLTITDTDELWQMPIQLSPTVWGGYEASSPYGYSGISVDAALTAGDVTRLWGETLAALKNLGVVSLFLRFAPFDSESVGRLRDLDGLTLSHVSDTIEVRLPDEETVWDGMQGKARTAIRKAEKTGLRAAIVPANRASLAQGSHFRKLYEGTMRRVAAKDHHFYLDHYYHELSGLLGEDLKLVEVYDEAGETVASALMIVESDLVHYHLSGSEMEHARNGANNLLIWTMLRWAISNGRSAAHLGGGTAPGDSLYKFKASFGGLSVPFYVGKCIVDPKRYDDLVAKRAESLRVPAEELRKTTFFPAFRGEVVSDD